MQTIQFVCGNCGKLMAVATEFAGQQVRCPHCQQIVLAPPVMEPPPLPYPGLPSDPDDPESIFTETQSDDVLGADPSPQVDLMPEAAPASPSGAGGLSSVSVSYDSPPPEAVVAPAEILNPPAEEPWPGAEPARPESTWAPEPPAPEPRMPAPPAHGGSTLAMLALTLLVPYAVLMTAIAGYLYFHPKTASSATSPLEMLPDEGLNPGVRRVLHGRRYPAEGQEAALPDRLHVALGQSLQVGDLEVTPSEVALRTITIHTANFSPTQEKALVLKLHLKNVSTDVAFHPVDPFFDRSWKADDPNGKPYTYLTLGERQFYGGPIAWEDAIPRRDNPRQFIPEQHTDRELKPGQEMDTILCTNPHDPVEHELASYHGPLLWRVQLRRGLVTVRNRDASATAVVGVEFKDTDIRTK
jgi:hypothetical protein